MVPTSMSFGGQSQHRFQSRDSLCALIDGKTFAWETRRQRLPHPLPRGSQAASTSMVWSESSSGPLQRMGTTCATQMIPASLSGPRESHHSFGVPFSGTGARQRPATTFLSCTQSIGGNNEIVVARSNDNGTTFSAPQNVSLSPSIGSAVELLRTAATSVLGGRRGICQ